MIRERDTDRQTDVWNGIWVNCDLTLPLPDWSPCASPRTYFQPRLHEAPADWPLENTHKRVNINNSGLTAEGKTRAHNMLYMQGLCEYVWELRFELWHMKYYKVCQTKGVWMKKDVFAGRSRWNVSAKMSIAALQRLSRSKSQSLLTNVSTLTLSLRCHATSISGGRVHIWLHSARAEGCCFTISTTVSKTCCL